MYQTQNQTSISLRTQSSSGSIPWDLENAFSVGNGNGEYSRGSEIQATHARTQAIRSNKRAIIRNLRRSLQIPRTASLFGPDEQKFTIASLRDLQLNGCTSWSKQQSMRTDSTAWCSSKQFSTDTHIILQQAFSQKYELLKKLGQGAHSTVYKSSCKQDGQIFAIKIIKKVSPQNQKKLKNLFRMVKSLHHDNIIKYHDFFHDAEKNTVHVVMECSASPDLRCELSKRSLAGKNFSSQEILSIARQIASVIEYLHAEGICHRDLKPENILYSKQTGKIKVIDLDICGVKKLKSEKFDLWTSTGTLFYRAPQSFEVGYTEKADIWSLGVVIYELVTGKIPFKTQYQKDFLNEIKNKEIKFNTLQTSDKVKRLLEGCLQKDPKKRIQASEFLKVLNPKINDDSSILTMRNTTSQNSTQYFSDSDVSKICLGNLLKFSYF